MRPPSPTKEKVRTFQRENGLSDEQLAKLLEQESGKRVSAQRVADVFKGERIPKFWLRALEIDEEDPDAARPQEHTTDPAGLPREAGSDLLPPLELPFDGLKARERIEMIHVFGAKGASMAAKNPLYERAMAQKPPGGGPSHAENIANKWIEAAREDTHIARLVAYVTVGGAKGDLLMAYMSFGVTILIASGKISLGGPYAAATATGAAASESGAARNGKADSDAAGAVRTVDETRTAAES